MKHTESISFIYFSHFCLHGFSHGQRGGWIDLIHNTFLFHVVSTCTASISRCSPRRFPFLKRRLKVQLSLSAEMRLIIPRSVLADPVAESSTGRFLRKQARSVCESDLIAMFPSSSTLITFSCSGQGRTTFRSLVTGTGRLANTTGSRHLRNPTLSSSSHSAHMLYR